MANDWWARKLGSEPQPRDGYDPRVPNVRYVPEGNVTRLPMEYDNAEDTRGRQAPSTNHSSRCPGCNSGNYFSAPEAGSQRMRCYDCGYPLLQSGSGGGMPSSSSGPATPAKQVSNGSGFSWTIGEKM